MRVRGLGFESRRLHFSFFFQFYYFSGNANRPSRRAGMSASAELLVQSMILRISMRTWRRSIAKPPLKTSVIFQDEIKSYWFKLPSRHCRKPVAYRNIVDISADPICCRCYLAAHTLEQLAQGLPSHGQSAFFCPTSRRCSPVRAGNSPVTRDVGQAAAAAAVALSVAAVHSESANLRQGRSLNKHIQVQ